MTGRKKNYFSLQSKYVYKKLLLLLMDSEATGATELGKV